MFSTAILCWGSQDFARLLIVSIHNKIDIFIILQTSFNNIFKYIVAHFIEYIIDYAI